MKLKTTTDSQSLAMMIRIATRAEVEDLLRRETSLNRTARSKVLRACDRRLALLASL